MTPFTHLGLFEGIGGFSLAARWMGWHTKAWCEWNEFGQKVLKHHFPEAEGHRDIIKTDFTKYAKQISIITGGFPCQPYSVAGEQKGKEDERHLWPEMLRAIREVQPRWIVGENVLGLVDWNGGLVFHEVQTDLEAAGYEVWPYVLPAAGIGADHKRDRVWFIAHANSILLEGVSEQYTKSYSNGGSWRTPGEVGAYPTIGRLYRQRNYRDICRGNGFPEGMDVTGISFGAYKKESIKAYGNAIHPMVAYQIFKAIEQYENL